MSATDLHLFRDRKPRFVGTVTSLQGLAKAAALRPDDLDLIEVRLDAMANDRAEAMALIGKIGLPLIITARHPREGGENALPLEERRGLLTEFLPAAALVDIELRSLNPLRDVRSKARAGSVAVIGSFHHFKTTPSLSRMKTSARNAAKAGVTIFKIATVTSQPLHLANLARLVGSTGLPVSAMGMGRFGKVSRLLLAQAGSVLNYGYLDRPATPGQWEALTLKKRFEEVTAR